MTEQVQFSFQDDSYDALRIVPTLCLFSKDYTIHNFYLISLVSLYE